jgi:glycosyltransferase involved in cell wall biosynthesis
MTIPNGVSPELSIEDVRAVSEELEVTPETELVVHIGNIRPHKGHDTLIAATALLVRSRPQVRVISIGAAKRPGDLDRLRKAASGAGLSGQLSFLGRRPEALAFVAAADVFVNPADFEGLPVAILEAMALGRPVVATRVGGVASVVRDDDTGVLVDPGDPEALASAVARLLDDPAEAKRLGERGRHLVEAEYGLERMVRAYEEAYTRTLLDRDRA